MDIDASGGATYKIPNYKLTKLNGVMMPEKVQAELEKMNLTLKPQVNIANLFELQ
ncbi:MAG: hypothetical protein VZR09_10300 [Candidatus Gastranaerophilaceae bacterium]|nr:hypothetical protein [Candidatus Gastranaerophilaceae bacterium]